MQVLKNIYHTITLIVITSLLTNAAYSQISTHSEAPSFEGKGISGNVISSTDLNGSYIILEWFNWNCPFIVKHYKNGDMQRLQELAKSNNIVWLQVNSTNPSHQDYMSSADLVKLNKELKSHAVDMLLDSDGVIGQAFGARTTPHMFIIDPDGVLIYQGAIDSIRSTNPDDISKADPYILNAINNIISNESITVGTTRPYGCSIKY